VAHQPVTPVPPVLAPQGYEARHVAALDQNAAENHLARVFVD
jgi:hypothetical protein